MELKLKYQLTFVHNEIVSIVPLWNWNSYEAAEWTTSNQFQSYLYGIEIPLSVHLHKYQRCFNRTFMELKLSSIHHKGIACTVSIVPLWNWNTVRVSEVDVTSEVSIVPLWNWNRKSPWALPKLDSFNRTFMELKFVPLVFILSLLMFQSYLYGIEIKQNLILLVFMQVSIVPLWNWNSKLIS